MSDANQLWPRMRAVVAAVVEGLSTGQLVDDSLDGLRTALGASSVTARLGSASHGQVFRSQAQAARFHGDVRSDAHADTTIGQVLADRRTLAGARPDAAGCFVALPVWSSPPTPRFASRLAGALYLEFSDRSEVARTTIDFVESAALLIGGVTHQQSLIDATKEDLRATRVQESASTLNLDDLLAPPSMQEIRTEVLAALPSNSSIMILGESGTGKTQLATAIARASAKEPIVRATLGLSDDLNTITSELFGHERGSFSGAASKRKGLVEYADGGTLILDEVLNLPAHAQQLLLDFTQFGTYRPLGYQGSEPKRAEIRLISVTNGNIAQAIADTRFRQDLYFRLATMPLVMPPLRERRADIPGLALGYLRRTDPHHGWAIEPDAQSLLCSSHLEWAGNIRELEGVLERARNRVLASGEGARSVRAEHLQLGDTARISIAAPDFAPAPSAGSTETPLLERWASLGAQRADLDAEERAIIEDALMLHRGVVAKTARELNVSRTGLISRMATLEINALRFKEAR